MMESLEDVQKKVYAPNRGPPMLLLHGSGPLRRPKLKRRKLKPKEVVPIPYYRIKHDPPPSNLPASALPDGFPPELAFRALAAYSFLRTVGCYLRLSPFTPNVFLRALNLPYPNKLMGQIHTALLRILLANLNMGYNCKLRGGAGPEIVIKKRRVDGIKWPLRAGDNLTFLDTFSWPLFYDDFCHLTADVIWASLNANPESFIDLRNMGMPKIGGVDLPEEIYSEESEEDESGEEDELLMAKPAKLSKGTVMLDSLSRQSRSTRRSDAMYARAESDDESGEEFVDEEVNNDRSDDEDFILPSKKSTGKRKRGRPRRSDPKTPSTMQQHAATLPTIAMMKGANPAVMQMQRGMHQIGTSHKAASAKFPMHMPATRGGGTARKGHLPMAASANTPNGKKNIPVQHSQHSPASIANPSTSSRKLPMHSINSCTSDKSGCIGSPPKKRARGESAGSKVDWVEEVPVVHRRNDGGAKGDNGNAGTHPASAPRTWSTKKGNSAVQRILDFVLLTETLRNDQNVPRVMVVTVAGVKISTLQTTFSVMKKEGLIDYDKDFIRLTKTGRDKANPAYGVPAGNNMAQAGHTVAASSHHPIAAVAKNQQSVVHSFSSSGGSSKAPNRQSVPSSYDGNQQSMGLGHSQPLAKSTPKSATLDSKTLSIGSNIRPAATNGLFFPEALPLSNPNILHRSDIKPLLETSAVTQQGVLVQNQLAAGKQIAAIPGQKVPLPIQAQLALINSNPGLASCFNPAVFHQNNPIAPTMFPQPCPVPSQQMHNGFPSRTLPPSIPFSQTNAGLMQTIPLVNIPPAWKLPQEERTYKTRPHIVSSDVSSALNRFLLRMDKDTTETSGNNNAANPESSSAAAAKDGPAPERLDQATTSGVTNGHVTGNIAAAQSNRHESSCHIMTLQTKLDGLPDGGKGEGSAMLRSSSAQSSGHLPVELGLKTQQERECLPVNAVDDAITTGGSSMKNIGGIVTGSASKPTGITISRAVPEETKPDYKPQQKDANATDDTWPSGREGVNSNSGERVPPTSEPGPGIQAQSNQAREGGMGGLLDRSPAQVLTSGTEHNEILKTWEHLEESFGSSCDNERNDSAASNERGSVTPTGSNYLLSKTGANDAVDAAVPDESAKSSNAVVVDVAKSESVSNARKAPDGEVSVREHESPCFADSDDQWPQFKPVRTMRSGVPYHRLPLEEKLTILEFLIDELLMVDAYQAEFSRRELVTGSYDLRYGPLPTLEELDNLENEDECAVCQEEGDLLCCDGCVSSYHRQCIDMGKHANLPEGRWLCPECELVDSAKYGSLRGGSKSSLDWFKHEDVLTASSPRNLVVGASSVGEDMKSIELVVDASNQRSANMMSTDGDSLVASGANSQEEGVEQSTVEQPGAVSMNPDVSGTTVPAEDRPKHDSLADYEFLVVHGFVFARRHRQGGTSQAPLDSQTFVPLSRDRISQVLERFGPTLSLSWPLAQIPFTSLKQDGPIVTRGVNHPDTSTFFTAPSSYEPSYYLSKYRKTPLPKAVAPGSGFQNISLLLSEYETACTSVNYRRLSERLTRNMAHDSLLSQSLRVDTALFDPYQPFKDYMLKLEGSLYRACLLNEFWGTRNKDVKFDVWQQNVRNTRSIPRLAMLLVQLVDATHSRAFVISWFEQATLGKVATENVSEAIHTHDAQVYLPLASDWTPEAEKTKRLWERGTNSSIRAVLSKEDSTVADWVLGETNVMTDSAMLRRKRKRSLMSRSPKAEDTNLAVSPLGSFGGQASQKETAPRSVENISGPTDDPKKDISSFPRIRNLQRVLQTGISDESPTNEISKTDALIIKMDALVDSKDEEQIGSPKKKQRRTRRSDRLQVKHENPEEFLHNVVAKAEQSNKVTMDTIIEAQKMKKLVELEGLVSVTFFEPVNHWPLAGRLLYDPLGTLSKSEVRRLARNAGTAVAPFVSYTGSYEVGEVAVAHIWRKNILRSVSFEQMALQIRVLESHLDKHSISSCESFARKTPEAKAQMPKVIRCTQNDPETGAAQYFVVNTSKNKQAGCWMSPHDVDLAALVIERSKHRDKRTEAFNSRLKVKAEAEAKAEAAAKAKELADAAARAQAQARAHAEAKAEAVRAFKASREKAIREKAEAKAAAKEAEKAEKARARAEAKAAKDAEKAAWAAPRHSNAVSVPERLQAASADPRVDKMHGIIQQALQDHKLATQKLIRTSAMAGLASVPEPEVKKLRLITANRLQILKIKDESIFSLLNRTEKEALLSEQNYQQSRLSATAPPNRDSWQKFPPNQGQVQTPKASAGNMQQSATSPAFHQSTGQGQMRQSYSEAQRWQAGMVKTAPAPLGVSHDETLRLKKSLASMTNQYNVNAGNQRHSQTTNHGYDMVESSQAYSATGHYRAPPYYSVGGPTHALRQGSTSSMPPQNNSLDLNAWQSHASHQVGDSYRFDGRGPAPQVDSTGQIPGSSMAYPYAPAPSPIYHQQAQSQGILHGQFEASSWQAASSQHPSYNTSTLNTETTAPRNPATAGQVYSYAGYGYGQSPAVVNVAYPTAAPQGVQLQSQIPPGSDVDIEFEPRPIEEMQQNRGSQHQWFQR